MSHLEYYKVKDSDMVLTFNWIKSGNQVSSETYFRLEEHSRRCCFAKSLSFLLVASNNKSFILPRVGESIQVGDGLFNGSFFCSLILCIFKIFYNKILKRKKSINCWVSQFEDFISCPYLQIDQFLLANDLKKKEKEKKTWPKEVITHIQTSKIQERIYSEES